MHFTYDGQSRRISKVVSNWTGSAWTRVLHERCLYDGWNLLAALNGTNNAVVKSFLWGSDLSGSEQGAGGVGGLLLVNFGSVGCAFPAYDGNGNVSGLVSASDGTLTAQYEYGPFGELLRVNGAMAKTNPFRFSTKYQDEETDLLYYGYRYLSTVIGRWLSRDPIEEAGGRNLYGFAYNDGIRRYDKLGQNPSSPEAPPPNSVVPQGPFSKCRIALRCGPAHAFGIPLPIDHCGLVIDTGDAVFEMHGTGGSINTVYMVPSTISTATGTWKDFSTSVCDCLVSRMAGWNGLKVPRNNTCENSNWNLKCSLKKCGVALDWGSQPKPMGYDCRECTKRVILPTDGLGPRTPCCVEQREKPCPDA